MNEISEIENRLLKIAVKHVGAELCSVRLLPENKEYMWQADPAIWAGHAPVLFPVVGALKDGSFIYRGEKYALPQHGFFRKNPNVELVERTVDSLKFCLTSTDETLEHYPFNFEFYVSYALQDASIHVEHEVKNTGSEEMFFALGGHPAFKCPINEGEVYSDYYLEFAQKEKVHTYEITSQGLIGGQTDLIMDDTRTIDLHYKLFDKGALIFKNIISRQVSLVSRISGEKVRLSFEGFPYLGIWAKPTANYVCIEPWLGIADSVDSDQEIVNKEGILSLAPSNIFNAGYSIQVFK